MPDVWGNGKVSVGGAERGKVGGEAIADVVGVGWEVACGGT